MTDPATSAQGLRETDVRDAVAYLRAALRHDQEATLVLRAHADPLRTWVATSSILIGMLLHFCNDDVVSADGFLETILQGREEQQ